MAKTFHSFKPWNSRFLLLSLLLQVLLVGASPTTATKAADEALAKRARAKYPTFSNDYDGRVKKGEYLMTLLPVGNAEAAERNGGASIISPFQDPESLVTWGWTPYITWYPYETNLDGDTERLPGFPGYGQLLDEAFADPEYRVDEEHTGVYHFVQDKTFRKWWWLRVGQPSEGSYKNVANPPSGAFIFDVNYSPRYEVAKNGKGDVPDLDTLSDIAYFQWLSACEYKRISPKTLKVVFRAGISYKPTFDIAMRALKDENYDRVPGWDKRAVFKMDSRPGHALLGSTHGAGTAWMLIQHKENLGIKTITEVTVWGSNGGFDFKASPNTVRLNLRFVINDA
ncbi:hypothetical protein CDEST_10840 [Colletotrichum destructivum]|uniref:Uncharacterized protein n=1 Tax=Colletotrichum destructivum TaxID=34406 RepID=A0AAX4IRK0_9PEZI|nr:hypothetical protein CDEST_10840 [Colletotrichum destructivum]